MNNYRNMILTLLITFLFCNPLATSFAQKKSDNSKLVYVPVYSSIYHGDQVREFDLAITLTVRNINSNKSITVYSIDYYGNSGNLIRNYLNKPKILKPYETANIVVKESDTHGGSSASFLIKWDADRNVNDLFVEAVMIGTQQQQGISFTSRGIPVKK